MVRLLAIVEYDGTDFFGFQLQAHRDLEQRTVQGELERALFECTGETIRVVGSGRTDTGVHARGQVVHFDTEAALAGDPAPMMRALNAHLPEDAKIRALHSAPPGFHARFSALSRTYCYRILAGPAPSPLLRRYTHHARHRLSVAPMAEAAQHLVGTHDFVAFAAQEESGSTVRRLLRAQVAQSWANPPVIWHTSVNSVGALADSAVAAAHVSGSADGSAGAPPAGETQLIEIEIEASGFLRHMMRRIAGTLIRVGDGRLDPAGVASILHAKRKNLAGPTAPAKGLCLEQVRYQAVNREELL